MFLLLGFIIYCAFGLFAYGNDVFDHKSANLVDCITYTLIGGLVITIRVFRNSIAILGQELEGVQTPQFVIDMLLIVKSTTIKISNSIKSGATAVYKSI